MEELTNELLKQIDLGSSLEIYGATIAVLWVLNVLFRKTYTDWVAPGVAVVMGQIQAFMVHNHFDGHAVVHGFKIAGGAIVFQAFIKKGVEGFTWLKRGKEDPVLKAKVEATSTAADAQIAKMKALLAKKKEEK